jgi:hypothetical protein
MNRPCRDSALFCGIAIGLAAVGAPAAATQGFPGKPLIHNAAQQLNSITPPAVPQQTIVIGHFNGATNTFTFALEPSYPPGTPDYKKAEYGGPFQPMRVAEINSYNVTYEFGITNKPAAFGITVAVRQPNGTMLDTPAIINTSGTKATVSFNPRAFGKQLVKIQRPGPDTAVLVTPQLREQLGAFVVPYMLVGIVYEPPGASSSAEYKQTETANTVVSFGFARTSGLVETVDPEAMINLFVQGMSAGVDKLYPGAGQAMQVIAGLREQHTITKTTAATVGGTQSNGTSVSVSIGFDTDLHLYPGGGDRFIVLHDVLFVYAVHKGKVLLTPMAYSGALAMTKAEIQQQLPAAVAQQFLALDPHFGGGLPGTLTASKRVPLISPSRTAIFAPSGSRFEKFARYATVACQASGGNLLDFTQADFSATTISRTTSETQIEKVTGLVASIQGGGDKMSGVTYSTARQEGTAQSQSTSVRLQCASNDQFWVDVFFDNLFHTFLTLRGEPLSGTATIAGSVSDDQGRPRPSVPVTLTAGGQGYVVFSDATGNFTLPVNALPRGSVSLSAGGRTSTVSYAGTPITGVKIVVGAAAGQATTQPPIRVEPITRPKVKPRTP